ncbi:hypothetical protein PLICRDRAFT_474855 [Plicaturopsis crispa FD-325 SS-3]|nr:hypothetical protein PLICRDRAFT_474855 [Plicaturopsis crispa FD-325 SS-3]
MLSSRPVQFNDSSIVKTPGRTLIKGRANLQENAARHTVNPKARHTHTVNGKAGGQKTPFHPATLQPQRLFGKDKHAVAARPLIDKTPFPNRTHPAPAHPPTGKKSGALLELRPSSTRKHIRTPRPSLQTPAVSGNPWDVSDISITTNTIAAESDSAINEEDHDALEYMPPTAVDVPYDPGFEMPEYAVLGRALWAGACTWPVDDELRVWPVDDEPRVWDGKEEGEGEEGVGWVDVGLVDVGLVLPELGEWWVLCFSSFVCGVVLAFLCCRPLRLTRSSSLHLECSLSIRFACTIDCAHVCQTLIHICSLNPRSISLQPPSIPSNPILLPLLQTTTAPSREQSLRNPSPSLYPLFMAVRSLSQAQRARSLSLSTAVRSLLPVQHARSLSPVPHARRLCRVLSRQ